MNNDKSVIPILVVLGPTASGKTSFAVKLAEHFGGEIISADSRQLYKGMDIGSGKDITEYTLPGGRKIPYHLIDIVEPSSDYNLAEFMKDCHAAIKKIHANGNRVILAGGTALYLDSILRSYKLEGGAPSREERQSLRNMSAEELRKQLAALEPDSEILKNEPDNLNRISRRIEMLEKAPDETLLAATMQDENIRYRFFVTGVFRPREEIRRRIELRLDERLANGMLDEERMLHEEKGVSFGKLEFFGLEYKYMALYLQNKLSYEEMRSELLNKIRQFAKRQDSWFRYIERRGIPIHWFTPEVDWEKAVALGERFFAGEELPPPEKRLSEIFYGKVTSIGKKYTFFLFYLQILYRKKAAAKLLQQPFLLFFPEFLFRSKIEVIHIDPAVFLRPESEKLDLFFVAGPLILKCISLPVCVIHLDRLYPGHPHKASGIFYRHMTQYM